MTSWYANTRTPWGTHELRGPYEVGGCTAYVNPRPFISVKELRRWCRDRGFEPIHIYDCLFPEDKFENPDYGKLVVFRTVSDAVLFKLSWSG